MTAARARYHHGDLKRALTDAAIALLAEVGPGFTLRQVADRVGVTHAAAYRHFADREALLAEVSARGYLALEQRMARAIRGARAPRGQLEAVLTAYLRFAWRSRFQYEVMFGRRLNESGRFPELEAAIARALRVLLAAIAAYTETTDPVRCRDAAIALWSFAAGFTANVLARRIHVRSLAAAEAYLRHVVAPLLDGLAPPAAGARRPRRARGATGTAPAPGSAPRAGRRPGGARSAARRRGRPRAPR